MKYVKTCTVVKYTYYEIIIIKNTISTLGMNIFKRVRKTKYICGTNTKKCPFLSHNFS